MNDLPKLKTPQLNEALDFYFTCLQPILSDFELKEVQNKIDQFKIDAKSLDEKLKKHIEDLKQNENWLLPFWEKMYLSIRGSLLTQSNYALHLRDFEDKDEDNDHFMARFIIAAASYYKSIYLNPKKELKLGKYSFCLDLVNNLFASSRIPKKKIDKWKNYPDFKHHIIINHKQNCYSIELFDSDKNIICLKSLVEILKYIKNKESGFNFYPAGYHGSKKAAKFLKYFKKQGQNKQTIKCLNTSIFHVSLTSKDYENYDDFISLAIKNKEDNIWPYKSINFILWNNQRVSLHMEHTGADGVYVVYLLEQIINTFKNSSQDSGVFEGYLSILGLQFDEKSTLRVRKAAKDFNKQRKAYKAMICSFKYSHPSLIKCSSDFLAGLALQYCLDKPRSIYSACSMNHFYHGRTEALYTQSIQARAFIHSLNAGKFDAKLFEAALNEHKNRIKLAKAGKGFARYFSGLAWLNKDLDLDYFYGCRAMAKLQENYFSTSTVGKTDGIIEHFAFTPPDPSSFGIGYLVADDGACFNVIYKDELKAKQFLQKLASFEKLLNTLVS